MQRLRAVFRFMLDSIDKETRGEPMAGKMPWCLARRPAVMGEALDELMEGLRCNIEVRARFRAQCRRRRSRPHRRSSRPSSHTTMQ